MRLDEAVHDLSWWTKRDVTGNENYPTLNLCKELKRLDIKKDDSLIVGIRGDEIVVRKVSDD